MAAPVAVTVSVFARSCPYGVPTKISGKRAHRHSVVASPPDFATIMSLAPMSCGMSSM